MSFKIKAFLVVSRFNENVDWIHDFTDDYIVYNKGEPLPDTIKQIMSRNVGGNQYDIFRHILLNYDNLPELLAFVQGNPFDHCRSERFKELIYSESFTPLFGEGNYPNGNYSEDNTSWYINGSWLQHAPESKFASFDDYMNFIFSDYVHQDKLIFPPGSQIIVERERCLFYSKNFWRKLMDIFPTQPGLNGGREAHIIERSVQIIFENKYHE